MSKRQNTHASILSRNQPIFAAIDLGTNSCRLLICCYDGKMRILDSYAKVVRLGENIQNDDSLLEDAIDRSIKALSVCMQKVKRHNVTHLRAITTEACRRAKNGHVLIQRASQELNLNLEVIASAEEAHLAMIGCAGVLTPHIPYAIAFDIGGGSTEVMWVKVETPSHASKLLDWISLPFGVVTLSDAYGSYGTSPQLYQHVREKIARTLDMFNQKNNIQQRIVKQQVQMIGTSGTITTLSAVSLNLPYYDRNRIDGLLVKTQTIRAIAQNILYMESQNRNLHPCIGVGRSDLVVTGSAILEGIFDAFHMPWVRVADRGVREGILMKMIQQYYKINV